MDAISGVDALDAVRHIRAISWRWRLTGLMRAPSLIFELGRRRYGVAAQDVERELGDRVPGIVLRTGNGLLRVRYGLLADVVGKAADSVGLPRPAGMPADRERPRWCYEQIAAIQLLCRARDLEREGAGDDGGTGAPNR